MYDRLDTSFLVVQIVNQGIPPHPEKMSGRLLKVKKKNYYRWSMTEEGSLFRVWKGGFV